MKVLLVKLILRLRQKCVLIKKEDTIAPSRKTASERRARRVVWRVLEVWAGVLGFGERAEEKQPSFHPYVLTLCGETSWWKKNKYVGGCWIKIVRPPHRCYFRGCHLQILFNVLICWQHTAGFKSLQYAFTSPSFFLHFISSCHLCFHSAVWTKVGEVDPILHTHLHPPAEIRLKQTCRTQHRWVARLEQSMLGCRGTHTYSDSCMGRWFKWRCPL